MTFLISAYYTGKGGDTVGFIAGFNVNPNVVSLISILNRIFP